MSEHLLEQSTEGSVYKISTIRLATFFCGPLAGAYMMATNFKTFDDAKKSNLTWLFTGLILVATVLLNLAPSIANLPGVIYAVVYFSLANFFATRYQKQNIELHLQNGGKEFSKGNAFLVCVLSILVMVAMILALFFIQDFYIGRY